MNRSIIERELVGIAGLIAIVGVLAVSFTGGMTNILVIPAILGIVLSSLLVHIIIRNTGYQGDHILLPLCVALVSIGLVIILRLNIKMFWLQCMWVVVGLIVFGCTVYCAKHIENLINYKYLCGLIGVSLLLTAILFGTDINGHRSWVIIGSIRFQPSEFAKLFVVIFLAAYLSERRELIVLATKRYGFLEIPHPRFIAPLLVVWGLTMVMFVAQRDMGSALLFFGVAIIMTYMASGKPSYLIGGLVLFFVGTAVCYKLYYHIQTRVDIWLDPWSDPSGGAYQIVQSLFALGSGGVLGSGLTFGFPHYIPEVHTDFIFAAIGEELGFMGTGAVLIMYILLIYRCFSVALLAKTPFTSLVASGLAVAMSLQIFLIVGGVTKFFPLTGVTLPLISYGGSSIVSNFMVLGIVAAISETRYKHEKPGY